MPPGPVHLHIADVLTEVPASAGVDAGMVVLTEDNAPYRSLRIIIGTPETRAILAGWHGDVPGRPSTWDLFVSTVAILGARVDRAVITGVQEERHYFAQIELDQAGQRRIISCRPSDAIALAVRAYNAGIFAEESVLADAGVLPDGTRPVPTSPDDDRSASGHADADIALAAREAAIAAREAALAIRHAELEARERALTASQDVAATGAPAPGVDVPMSGEDRPVPGVGPAGPGEPAVPAEAPRGDTGDLTQPPFGPTPVEGDRSS